MAQESSISSSRASSSLAVAPVTLPTSQKVSPATNNPPIPNRVQFPVSAGVHSYDEAKKSAGLDRIEVVSSPQQPAVGDIRFKMSSSF